MSDEPIYPGVARFDRERSERVRHGRPADDWPGIPGIAWGMGSRVRVTRPDGAPFGCGVVVGAVSAPNALGWEITVRFDDDRKLESVDPTWIELEER